MGKVVSGRQMQTDLRNKRIHLAVEQWTDRTRNPNVIAANLVRRVMHSPGEQWRLSSQGRQLK